MSSLLLAVAWNAGTACVLGGVVAMVGRWRLLQCRPALMHTLWLLVLAKLVAPPLVQVPVRMLVQANGIAGQANTVDVVSAVPMTAAGATRDVAKATGAIPGGRLALANSHVNNPSIPWVAILCGGSFTGTLLLLFWGALQHAWVVKILRLVRSADERLANLARDAASRMNVRCTPRVCTVDAAVSPFLWTRLRGPVIVLPRRLVSEMSEQQVVCILCHELAHYARRDHWANLFALAVNALFWWHPIAWWARREMRATQETCCDALAVSGGGVARQCYAQTLLESLEFVQSQQPWQPMLASGFGGSSSLRRRFQMIATLQVQSRSSRWAGVLVLLGAVAMFCAPIGAQVSSDAGGWTESATIEMERPVSLVCSNLDWLAVGDEGGNVFVYNAKTLKDRRRMVKGAADGGDNHSVDRFQITPDGTNLYAVLDNFHSMWQLHLVNAPPFRTGAGVGGGEPHYFGFSFDTETWLERHADKTVLALRNNIWGPNARPGFERIDYEAEITHSVLSEDVKWLAVVTADEKLHIHDRASLRELHTISMANQPVTAIQLSRDGKMLAVVGERGFAKVYDTTSGNEIADLKGHEGNVHAAAFSPDGKSIVTGGGDNTVRLWNAEDGQAIGVLSGHKDAVKSVAFDPSGDRLYSGSRDKTVKVWKRK